MAAPREHGPMRLLRLLCAAPMLACALGPGQLPTQPLARGGHHVLFIGNSLTYANDLPGTVEGLAASVGDTIRTRSVAFPDFAVIDHARGLGGGAALAAVSSERWDIVILQQGPTPAGLDRDTLLLAARIFAPRVAAAGARIAALMTWPSATQQTQFPLLYDQTRDSCLLEAAASSGTCYLAGEAWRSAWARNASLPLYGSDSYHPSALGTYLMALVVYEKVTGHDARGLPPTATVAGNRLTTSESTVRLLQSVAHETASR